MRVCRDERLDGNVFELLSFECVMSTSLLRVVVYTVPISVVVLAVVLGFATLADAVSLDGPARLLYGGALLAVVVAVTDALILLTLLGLRALMEDQAHGMERPSGEAMDELAEEFARETESR